LAIRNIARGWQDGDETMYLILVYDIEEDRVAKVLKTCRKYLNWIQNSVFEGEITKAKLEELKADLKEIIEKDKDSVVFYKMRTTKYLNKEIMGKEKSEISSFI
jgi:CRISPR-associated protein Cas2